MNDITEQKPAKKDVVARPVSTGKPAVVAKPKAAARVPAKKLSSSTPAVQAGPDATKPVQAKAQAATPKSGKKLALILIRGIIRTREDVIATLFTLRLRKKHACVVIDDTPSLRAAAVKCKDYIAYGEIDDDTYKLLLEKRGKKNKDGSLRKFFSLHPPRGGFSRKGIKTPFTNGGTLGYMGLKINDLIRKML